jgi:hypothetical protein
MVSKIEEMRDSGGIYNEIKNIIMIGAVNNPLLEK